VSLELRQQLKLAQKLVMTQQLQQAIKLLQLNRLELVNAIQAELEQNPMLEEAGEPADERSNPEALSAAEVTEPVEAEATLRVTGNDPAAAAEINWEDYANTFDADFSFAHETPPADAPSRLDFVSAQPGLISFLAWQLSHLSLNERDLEIARFILGNLDGHGFLDAETAEICAAVSCSEEEAEALLRLIQSLDPPGIAARSIRESLLLQLERNDLEDTLAWRIVAEFFAELQGHNFTAIARRTKCPLHEVEQAAALISGLTPYPGNAHSNEQAQHVTPDVYVYKIEGEFVVSLNNEDLPQLRLSAEYQEMLEKNSGAVNAEAQGYLQDKKRTAQRFISSVQYRQNSICRVMESIIKFQREFFEQGPGHLRPLVLSDVAQDTGLHESTVSRVTANKYVHTPQGLYELKYFFSTAAAEDKNGDALTAESVKNRISHFIRSEDPEKPLSDSAIAELLEKEGVKVARRTVAKYREQMKILPVKHRRGKGR
jgi:RNA polymerase sigma-54 factor